MFFPHCSRKTILRVNLQLLKNLRSQFWTWLSTNHMANPPRFTTWIHGSNSTLEFDSETPWYCWWKKSHFSPCLIVKKPCFKICFEPIGPSGGLGPNHLVNEFNLLECHSYPCTVPVCHCKHSFNVLYISTFIWFHGISWQLKEFHSPVSSLCCR